MARRFFSLSSILNTGRVSVFFRWRPRAISFVEAGSPLTCRKRSMLSGFSWEVDDMRYCAGWSALIIHCDSKSLFLVHLKLFSPLRGFMLRPTHDRPVALRLTGRVPREGNKGGGKTWPVP